MNSCILNPIGLILFFFETNKQLFKSSSLVPNDSIIPVWKMYFNASLEIETKRLMKQVSCQLSRYWEIRRGKTAITIQIHPVLVSSSEFTKRAN